MKVLASSHMGFLPSVLLASYSMKVPAFILADRLFLYHVSLAVLAGPLLCGFGIVLHGRMVGLLQWGFFIQWP